MVGVTVEVPAVDVLDQYRAGGGAVALPQFVSADAVVGLEVERRAHDCELFGPTAGGSALDVLDHHRAGGGSVALPQFRSGDAVVGDEVERRAHCGEI